MEYIKISKVDSDNSFFHFTRIDNRESIEKNGLQAVAGGEHGVGLDRNHRAIYFSKGYLGLLKTVDVWARWEYNNCARAVNNSKKPGQKRIKDDYNYRLVKGIDDSYDKDFMKEVVFNRLYNYFKNVQYYELDLIEGKDGDFEIGDIDEKKVISRNERGEPLYRVQWQYGQYSDFGTPDNPNYKQEDWNMNTKFGFRIIPTDRLKILETENGRSDGISVLIEIYDKYKELYFKENHEFYENLENFIEYSKERYKDDIDFKDASSDYGRREINLNEERKFQEINRVKLRQINKEKNMSTRKDDFEKIENKYREIIFNNIKELDSEQFESISNINNLLTLLGENDVRIPRSVVTLNNKINQLASEFKKAGTSIYVKESKETGLIIPSFVGNAVIHDLIDMACSSSDSLCRFSSTLIEVSKERDKRVNAIVTASPLRKFIWQVRSLFGKEVQLNASLTKEEEDKLSNALDEYRDKDDQIFKYKLKDNMLNAIVKEIRNLINKGTFRYLKRIDKDNISGFIEDSISPDLEKLGLESLIPKIEETIKREYEETKEQIPKIPATNKSETKKKPDMDPIN